MFKILMSSKENYKKTLLTFTARENKFYVDFTLNS